MEAETAGKQGSSAKPQTIAIGSFVLLKVSGPLPALAMTCVLPGSQLSAPGMIQGHLLPLLPVPGDP